MHIIPPCSIHGIYHGNDVSSKFLSASFAFASTTKNWTSKACQPDHPNTGL
jgi:hypothetical protein